VTSGTAWTWARARRGSSNAGALMFGKLTWQAIPLDQPIPLVAGAVVVNEAPLSINCQRAAEL
jgi:hypothetical protein